MFGAETLLMNRAVNEKVFNKTVNLINDFKKYFKPYNQIISDNPSPSNDSVSTMALAASGCQLILFFTGHDTPWGTITPVIKIATNTQLANYKANWIDFNADELVNNIFIDSLRDKLFNLIIKTASGQLTKSEHIDFHEIAIMKDGVTE